MIPNPTCTCGSNSWAEGGSQMGSQFYSSTSTCQACGYKLLLVSRQGWGLALLTPPGQIETALAYANREMVIQARVYHALWQQVHDAQMKILYDHLLLEWGLDPAKGCNFHYLDVETTGPTGTIQFEYRDNEGRVIEGLDKVAFRAACNTLHDRHPPRPERVYPPDPLNVPEGINAYVLRDKGWALAPRVTGTLPKDPQRVAHDRYFAEVFETVQKDTGAHFTPVEQDNRYHEDLTHSEPWYEFEVQGTKFMVGPRKRVVHISFASPTLVDCTPLKALANQDQVTFEARPPWQDRGDELAGTRVKDLKLSAWIQQVEAAFQQAEAEYTGNPNMSSQVLIHAWGKTKTIEYLTTAVRLALEVRRCSATRASARCGHEVPPHKNPPSRGS